jgi:hypothetical protein
VGRGLGQCSLTLSFMVGDRDRPFCEVLGPQNEAPGNVCREALALSVDSPSPREALVDVKGSQLDTQK